MPSNETESNSDTNSQRALRGGSWIEYDARMVRAAKRDWFIASLDYDVIGFRCGRDFAPSDLEGAG